MKKLKQFIGIFLLISMLIGLLPSQSCNALAESAPEEILNSLKFKAAAAGYDFSLALKEDGTVLAYGKTTDGQCAVPDDLFDVKAIAAGYAHSMALKEDGTVVAWGDNSYYQCTLPDGLTDVIAISAGDSHSMALKEDGTVVAWGYNYYNQTTVPDGLTDVIAISAGGSHSMALKKDGTVVAWGNNSYDQTTVPEGLTDVIAISAGGNHSMALKEDGTVVAWGNDSYNKTTVPEGLTDVIAISAGSLHCLALKNDGSVVTWGQPSYFQMDVPEDLTDAKFISAGYSHNIAIRQNGTIVTWGSDSSGECSFTETIGVTDIVAGEYSNLVLKEDGTVDALKNYYHSIGSATPSDYSVPEGLKDVTAIASGYGHYLALKEDETVVGWGQYYPDSIPVSLPKVVAVAAGEYHSVVLTEDGMVVAWGDNYNQQCDVPEGLTNVKSIYAANNHTAAIKEDGTVVVWGPDKSELCNIPEGLSNVKEVAIGETHILALKEDGTVVAWGSEAYYKLNSEDITLKYAEDYGNEISVPEGLSNVKSIAAGTGYSIAVKNDGTVVSWGDYPYAYNISHLYDFNKLTNVKKISAYKDNTTVLTESGTLINYNSGEVTVHYFPPLSNKPETSISDINVSDNLISIQFAGSTLDNVSDEDFTITCVTNAVDGTVSETVYGSVYSFDKTTNIVILQVPEITPTYYYKYISYFVSYKGLVEAETNVIITPPLASPMPSSTPVFTPEPTLSATPEPTFYFTPVSTPSLTPEPTSHSTPNPTPNPTSVPTPSPTPSSTPSSTPTPTKTYKRSTPAIPTVTSPVETIPGPQETPVIEIIDYDKIIDEFQNDVVEIIKMYEGIEDPYNEKNELITKRVEKTIEKVASIKINCESNSIEVKKELVSLQSELALRALKDITVFLESQPYEPNRTIRKRIIIEVELSATELIIHLLKDIELLESLGIDIKISTKFGSIIIYHDNLAALLSRDLIIIMSEENLNPENIKIKSSVNLMFKYTDGTIIEKPNYKIGLELPYKDGNPNYCTIYHEVDSSLYSEQKDTKPIQASAYMLKKQNEKIELGFPYRNEKSEYSAVNAKPNKKAYNLGGHEEIESKTLRVNTASYGRYYVIEDKKTYNDISKEDPAAKEAIEVLSSKGIIHGKNNGSFDPDGELKRSEFVCLIVNVLNIIDDDASTDFIDVPLTAWYYNPVAIADVENLISGYPGKIFLGNNPINNQEIIKISASTLQTEKGYCFPKDNNNLLIYKDHKNIQNWARKYVSLGTREGLVVKRANGNFNAEAPCTRRDAALILYRLYKKL